MAEIENRFTGDVIAAEEGSIKSLAEKKKADLREANLYAADLHGANLYGAQIEFHQFPSIRLLSSLYLNKLPPDLNLEIMRWNCANHPHPEYWDEWAKSHDGGCPYRQEEELFHHHPDRSLWQPGEPTMTYPELALAICRVKGWGIRGYLEFNARPSGVSA